MRLLVAALLLLGGVSTQVLAASTQMTPTFVPAGSSGKVWHVGPDRTGPNTAPSPMSLWSGVSGILAAGDTVLIDACVYKDDIDGSASNGVNISAQSVFIAAILPPMSSPHCTRPLTPPNNANNPAMFQITQTPCLNPSTFTNCWGVAKGLWNLEAGGITIDHGQFTFAYNAPSDTNGAGLRIEAPSGSPPIRVQNSYFAHNQNGILVSSTGALVISNSEFYDNGQGGCIDSCTHQVYLGGDGVTIGPNVYFHELDVSQAGSPAGGNIGNQLKSRAKNTTIVGPVTIVDSPNSNHAPTESSYLIDIPQGGTITVTGPLLLEKGPNASQAVIMDTGENGADGTMNPAGPISVSGITFVNDFGSGVVGLHQGQKVTTATLSASQLFQLTTGQLVNPSGTTSTGPTTVSGSAVLSSRPATNIASPIQ